METKTVSRQTGRYYREKASEIIGLIKTRFITDEGFLSEKYPVTKKTLFDNFDDLVPFFLYFGEEEFLVDQVKLLSHRNLGLVEMCSQYNVLLTRRIDEWFGGLYSIWKKTGSPDVYGLLARSLEFAENRLINGSFLAAAYFPQTEKTAGYQETWSSGLLETFCEMKDDFPAAYSHAQRIMRSWCEHEYFQRYGLFPYRIFKSPMVEFIQKNIAGYFNPHGSFKRPTAGINVNSPGLKDVCKDLFIHLCQNAYYSQMMKSNSTSAFTLLKLYKLTGEAYWKNCLVKWMDAALASFCDHRGCVYMDYFPKTGRRVAPSSSPSFIFVDVLCDAAYFLKNEAPMEKYLDSAGKIIDYVLTNRMFNDLVAWDDRKTYAHIDIQIDFCVSLRRYAELTGRKNYRSRASDIMEAALKAFYTPDGYLTYQGRVGDNPVDPKYNALMLKGLINMMTLDQKIYPELHDIFKDR